MKYILIEYPKCSTCQKAKKWLEEHKVDFTSRNIVIENPNREEIRRWKDENKVELKKFFNTSGVLYKEMNLKEKLKKMTEEEQMDILASNGMLVKRPIIIGDGVLLIGFKEKEWADKLTM